MNGRTEWNVGSALGSDDPDGKLEFLGSDVAANPHRYSGARLQRRDVLVSRNRPPHAVERGLGSFAGSPVRPEPGSCSIAAARVVPVFLIRGLWSLHRHRVKERRFAIHDTAKRRADLIAVGPATG